MGKIVGIGPILEELREGYGDDQIEIAKILGEIGDPKAADALIGLLKSLEDIRCRRASRRDWPLINETKVAVILALGKLKDGRAVEALLYEYGGEQSRVVETALKESGIEAVVRKLTDAKRSIRDVAAQVLDHFGWQPQIDAERAQYLIAKEEWEDLARLGKAAVEPLIQVLKTEPEIDERGVESRQKASLLLAETGDRRAAEVVLHSLFASKRLPTFYGSEMRESWTSVMTRLFGDYTSMILRAALFTISGKTQTDAEGKYGKITYDLSESDRALQELCEIQTQVASNILHEISGRTDVKIRTGWGYDPHEAYGRFDCESDLNLEVQRKKAIEELSRRGNPRFDPTAYLKAAAWKL